MPDFKFPLKSFPDDSPSLMVDLEEEYKIKIPNQEVLKIQTVGQAVEAMVKRI